MSASSKATAARRLFVGIALDAAVRATCAAVAQRLRAAGFAAIYEDPAKLHLTLAFLGNVAAPHCNESAVALGDAAARCSRFGIVLDKLDAFPHARRPRVVYVGARAGGPAFHALAETVRNVYRSRGFTFKDDCVAHVTIARVKESKRPLPMLEIAPIRLEIAALSLFESIVDPDKNTSRYALLSQDALR
ncbi:MAG: RNA 2',3'-cyclic phosphodiesterase [Candidatus Tumulicola sp.]